MKLLYVTPRYHPHVGGVEYVVKSVAERLVRRGCEVTVLCGEPSIKEYREEWINGVHIVRWPTWSPESSYHVPKMRNKLKNWLLGVKAEYDLVHFHNVHSILPIYTLNVLKRERTLHKVLTGHYLGTGHNILNKNLWKIWKYYLRKLLKFVDVVHAVSNFEAQLIERDFKVKAITIEHGVDELVLETSWSPLDYIIYSGRIEKYKNIHKLANVVKILKEDFGMNLELKIFGSGSYVDQLDKHLKKLGLKYSIAPPQPFEKYIENLSRALIFGLLSEREAYPQSVNEATAIGVPTVVVEPWGLSFSNRSRVLITQLSKSNKKIALEIVEFLELARKQPRSKVPSWNQVVDAYIKNIYKCCNEEEDKTFGQANVPSS